MLAKHIVRVRISLDAPFLRKSIFMIFLIIYCLVSLGIILGAIYLDVDHYKAYKSLPQDPYLLGGSILAVFWPFALVLLIIVLINSWFGIVYNKLISLLAK